jgi:hypothetical protein
LVAVGLAPKEGGFRQIHLGCALLHPAVVLLVGQEAHGGGVATEGLVGKGVNVEERHIHEELPARRRHTPTTPAAQDWFAS